MTENSESGGDGSGGYTPPSLSLPPLPPKQPALSSASASSPPPSAGTAENNDDSSSAEASSPAMKEDTPGNAAPGGLFAGLSLSSSSAPPKTTNAATSAFDAGDNSTTQTDDDDSDDAAIANSELSRANTPIVSNVSLDDDDDDNDDEKGPPILRPQPTRSPKSGTLKTSGPITAAIHGRKSESESSSHVVPPPPDSETAHGSSHPGPPAEHSKGTANATRRPPKPPATVKKSQAFLAKTTRYTSYQIHPPSHRPPSPDAALRILRKFYQKSSPAIPIAAGGTKPNTWFGWMFGSAAETAGNEDVCWKVYFEFSKAVNAGTGEEHEKDEDGGSEGTGAGDHSENTVIVESILGKKGDSPGKARNALATFIQLVSVWCHASAHAAALLMETAGENGGDLPASTNGAVGVVTPEFLGLAIDAASGLVAHGCLDDLYLKIGGGGGGTDNGESNGQEDAEDILREMNNIGNQENEENEANEVGSPSLIKKAVNVLVESVFVADLSSERTELSALKFLLTTGCRVSAIAANGENSSMLPPPMEPMLRGTHLLQTIRVCYHVYLKTGSMPNKTTAKAALQQLVTSVFVRLERAIERTTMEEKMMGATLEKDRATDGTTTKGKDAKGNSPGPPVFPSNDHRDAYLVLRSLCKLSMQTKNHPNPPAASSGSDNANNSAALTAESKGPSDAQATVLPHPAANGDTDPALESRILALELLLHTLRHSSGPCILQAGPQFHYAIRQYLCVSLLKNTTSPDTTIVELSLRLFVPLIRHFRSLLKTEIEAFVTNVFFVILDSKNSTIQHKMLVVTLFDEICSDSTTLAEIFLNYDCDLSAVDLFQRIVNALGKVARMGLADATGSGTSSLQFVAGAGALRAEKTRQDHRDLRLAAMKALRQILASLHSSIVTPVTSGREDISVDEASLKLKKLIVNGEKAEDEEDSKPSASFSDDAVAKKTLVEMYDSKKKRREEESQAALKFNQKPAAGLKYAAERGHLDDDDPVDVARYLLQNKDIFEKAQIGEYLGREKEWQGGFALKVLRAYGEALDFKGMTFDEAIRYYLSGFRLPGEAQKIDRIMEVFAARYTDQNPTTFPTADSAFILAFSIIMLNTDLHNPAIKEERKMTIQSFIRMNSGVCDGGDFPDEMLTDIFNRIKTDPISLKEDDDARESAGISKGGSSNTTLSAAGLSEFFFGSHYVELDKTRETNYQKEGDQIVRDTESMLRRRRKASKTPGKHHPSEKSRHEGLKHTASVKFVGTADSGLRDEYVTPMFDVTWGPSLAVFSTAIESANGTDGILASIATDEEMDLAVENASSAIEVCLNGFQLAICIAGLCGNKTARDAYVRALYNFTRLGTGRLLEDRHIQCLQSLLRLGSDDGELLGVTWEHIFRALSEIHRLHQVWEGMARSERAARTQRLKQLNAAVGVLEGEDVETNTVDQDEDGQSVESDDSDFLEDEMDKRMISEANALSIHETVPPPVIESIFHRSLTLSRPSLTDFVYQLCRVSRMEISGYGGHVGSDANDVDLTDDHFIKHHKLVSDNKGGQGLTPGVSGNQPAIYSLQKLVEVTHYNMESRPRLIFADIWGTISTHLTSTALHENAAVAMYAVDSLRQLSMQFLNREELGVFEFQRRFLTPLETIMARSAHVSVKELLLSSVEQLILLYGFNDVSPSDTPQADEKRNHQGTLRSGWRSVLIVLGTAGLDKNDSIASQGFKILSGQIQHCISVSKSEAHVNNPNQPDSILSEYFVDLVTALLLYVSGARQNFSTRAIDNLIQLSDLLAEGKVPISSTRKRSQAGTTHVPGNGLDSSETNNDELELWWPMLLGLSKTMGDPRHDVRVKGLTTLLAIINKHFFPSPDNKKQDHGEDSLPQQGDLQTLQLIFRGILVPALEFEEMDGNSTSGYAPELLPTKFVHFITVPPEPNAVSASGREKLEWISTTFEHLIDGCVSICLRSLEAFGSDALVEEVLAMLNSCLLSDSGHLAVKGLRRLQQFVTKDMNLKDVTDDTWATVSHMLFRVLSVRGLPPLIVPITDGASDEEKERLKEEHMETMNEFIREQQFFSNRRYIGCNATMVIGSLLTDDKIVESMGMEWYIFLTSGLGKGIRDWEKAAKIMDSTTTPNPTSTTPVPPHYLENVLYGRRWMTTFLLRLMMKMDADGVEAPPCQAVLKEETECLLQAFLAKEANPSCSVIDMKNISKMVSDLFDCFNTLGNDKIRKMKWLSPVLSSCIQTNNVTIRTSVQILLTKMLQESSPNNGGTVENAVKQPITETSEYVDLR